MFVPGYLEMEVAKDFIVEDITGKVGGSAFIAKGYAQSSSLRAKADVLAVKVFESYFPINDFQYEVAIMSQFNHPNIVQLLGYCQNPFCLIMKYYSLSLYDYISQGTSSSEITINLMADIARGMEGSRI
jgi:serine/threonine protein kinase